MKKRIFIGSSIEAKGLAEYLQRGLQEEFECVLWYEGFFSLGNHYYTDLIQKIITFDYAVMIGGEDDLVKRISTGSEKISPRDNVYLEYGLFSGILSPRRVLLLMHEKCMVASDLLGMSISQYRDGEQAVAIVERWLQGHTDPSVHRAISGRDVGLMPTVGIAVGYYYNFIKPFLGKLFESDMECPAGLTVLVPTFVCDDVGFYKRDLMLRRRLKEEVILKYRILRDVSDESELRLYDIPSSILSLFKTVNYVFGISEGNTADTLFAKQRALDDFYEHLQTLIAGDYEASRTVSMERYTLE